MIPKKIQNYLAKLEVEAEAVSHRTIYTAYDLAQTTKIKLEQIAKSLLVKVDPHYGDLKSKYVIAVVPASHNLDFVKLKKVLSAKKVSIPKEHVMVKQFKVKMGSLTAFGPLHKKTPVFIDKALTKPRKVLVHSGSFTDSLFLKTKDFIRATEGEIALFAKKVKRG